MGNNPGGDEPASWGRGTTQGESFRKGFFFLGGVGWTKGIFGHISLEFLEPKNEGKIWKMYFRLPKMATFFGIYVGVVAPPSTVANDYL